MVDTQNMFSGTFKAASFPHLSHGSHGIHLSTFNWKQALLAKKQRIVQMASFSGYSKSSPD